MWQAIPRLQRRPRAVGLGRGSGRGTMIYALVVPPKDSPWQAYEAYQVQAIPDQENHEGYASSAMEVDGADDLEGNHGEASELGRTETSNHTHIEFNDEVEARGGKIIPEEEIEVEELPPLRPTMTVHDVLSPFAEEKDIELAWWFARDATSKSSIEDYFGMPHQRGGRKSGPGIINSYQSLRNTLHDIPYGISNGDEWKQSTIEIPAQILGGTPEQLTVHYRPIQACLEFLLGHPPFADDLVWEPIRKSYGGKRVYDEMHTCDWWWEMDKCTPPGSTVVPIIVGSDKTLMTPLSSSQTAWPVYITIGNLPRALRRQQMIPATLLVGFIPITKAVTVGSDSAMSYEAKTKVYHDAMRIIFGRRCTYSCPSVTVYLLTSIALAQLAQGEWLVRCADGHIRHCVPIISNMLVDYEEVTCISGIKRNRQCGKCQVAYSELEQIQKSFPARTHEQMQQQIEKQGKSSLPEDEARIEFDWVHPIECFAWDLPFVDIYDSISIDMLHQLQKGVFRDLVSMTIHLIGDLKKGTRVTKTMKKKDRDYKNSPVLVQLDKRIR